MNSIKTQYKKELMRLILTLFSNHELRANTRLLGVHKENESEELVIKIRCEELLDKWAYIDFIMDDGSKYSTPRLTIENREIKYILSSGVMKYGTLSFQLVFRNESGYIWRSLIKKVLISNSILASDDLPEKYPDFISDAQYLIDMLEENEAERQANEIARQEAEERRGLELDKKVDKTTKVNNKALQTDIDLTPSDIGLINMDDDYVEALFDEL